MTKVFSISNTSSESFISVWHIKENNESITLPLREGFQYDFTVDWGDGTPIQNVKSWNDPNITHTYAKSGEYTITLSGLAEAWYFNNGGHPLNEYHPGGDKDKILRVISLGNMGWKNFASAFAGCANLKTVKRGNTSQVTDMSYMFQLAANTNSDPEACDTHRLNTIEGQFHGATSVNPDTSKWDTSNVTNMEGMFYGAASAEPDTSNWNTSKVTNMSGLFAEAIKANPDTSNWDTSNVTDMSYMFMQAIKANPDTSKWNTSNVTSMFAMFREAISANPDTSNWDTSNVTDMRRMFNGATIANPDTSKWNTSKVTDMSYMFQFTDMANPDVSHWDTSNVTKMEVMFQGAKSANPDTSNWDTSKVTSLQGIFCDAPKANPNISKWNTSKVTSIAYMFRGATSANPDLTKWDTSNVINTADMFKDATNIDPKLTKIKTPKMPKKYGILSKEILDSIREKLKIIQETKETTLSIVVGGFYGTKADYEYDVCRILDTEGSSAHVSVYKIFDHLPTVEEILAQQPHINHVELRLVNKLIDIVIGRATYIGKQPLTKVDLDGYYEYLNQVQCIDEPEIEEYFEKFIGKTFDVKVNLETFLKDIIADAES